MLKSIYTILFLCFIFISNSYAVHIDSVGFLFSDSSLATVVKDDNSSKIYRTSLHSCMDKESVKIDFDTKISFISKYYPSYLAAIDNNSIVMYNIINKKRFSYPTKHKKKVVSMIQDRTGEYLATTDGGSFIVYKLSNEKLLEMFKKDIIGALADYFIDAEKKVLYTADPNGVVSIWNFNGKLLSVTDLKMPILRMIEDNVFGKIFILSKQGLYLVAKNMTKKELFVKGRIDDILYDSRSARVIARVGGKYYGYDYTDKKLLYEIDAAGRELADINGANILIAYGKKAAYVYDLRFGVNIGYISYTKHGTIFFPPLEKPTLFSSPIDLIAQNEPRPILNDRVCTPFTSAVAGAFITRREPSVTIPDRPREVTVSALGELSVDGVNAIDVPNATKRPEAPNEPQITMKDGKVTKPILPSDPKALRDPNAPTLEYPRATEVPNKARLLADSDIPKWIIDRNRLPEFSVVKSGTTEEEVRISAERELKDRVSRSVMKRILAEKEFIKKMADNPLKKRMLWMIASGVTLNQIHKMKVNDTWISSNGQHYVFMSFNTDGIDGVFDTISEIEINKLKKMGDALYMKQTPNSLD